MKRVLSAFSIAAAISLQACGGGAGVPGSAAIPTTSPTNNPVQKTNATQSISFRIPMGKASKNPASSSAYAKRSGARPMYVSIDTANATIILDGNTVVNSIAVNQATAVTKSISGSNGETFSYTSTPVTDANNAGYYQVNATFNLMPGSHTLGVVLTAADGFVLSEDQETYTLTGGNNPNATMYLKGVADSAYLCDWPNCDGQLGTPAADGTYTLMAFAADHEGDSIPLQLDGNGNVIPLANGPISIVETDNKNVVTISNSGPWGDPGNDATMHNGFSKTVPNGWAAGHQIEIKCNSVGTATVAMKLSPNGPSHGIVNGFDYKALIDTSKDPVDPANGTPWAVAQTSVWTTPGQIIGTVPTFQDFGNSMNVNCDAALNLTVV